VMTRHVSAETMAGFRQGELSPRRTARIGAHLAGCDRCRALDEDLAGVRTLLAGAQPPPIPEHLAARIQTALATEAASRVVRPAGSHNGMGTAVPGLGRTARGHGWLPHLPHLPGLPRMGSRVALGSLAAAAAVLVVIGGMYEMFGSRGASSGSSGTAAGAPAHSSAGHAAGSEIGVPVPARLPASGPALQYRHSGHEDSVTPVTTDTDFTPGQLGPQAAAAVASHGAGMTKTGPDANPLSGVHSPAATPGKQPATFGNIPLALLQGCVNRIDAGELVVLVDVARYRGTPATIIVTEVTVIGPEQIWVVGTDCSASHSDVLNHATMPTP
jgi:anti-sigma factor RsiW